MSEASTGVNRLVRVGWIMFALGAIDLVRCIPEVISSPGMTFIYFAVLCGDGVQAILALIAGTGLRKERAWAWEPSALVWGLLPANSVVLFQELLPNYLRELRGNGSWTMMLIFLPRMLFYGFSMALMPYVLRVLLTSPREGRPSNRILWLFVAIGAACGAGIGVFVLALPK